MEKSQTTRGGESDYEEYYAHEQRRIEKDLDSIEDESISRKNLLMNIKMYDDSMKEMEIIKDRLGLWRESLEGLSESIGRDGVYIKEIAMKVMERKVEELISERKIILKKMVDKLENFMNVMKTSMDCMSNSITEFEKNVYSCGQSGDYHLTFDHKSNNRICKSYYQLSQRLKEYLKNVSPYVKDNLDAGLGLGTGGAATGLGLDLDQLDLQAPGGGLNYTMTQARRFECESRELKSILLEESKLLREPIILMIDPKRMQTINLRSRIQKSDLDEIISSSVTVSSSNDNNNAALFSNNLSFRPHANPSNSVRGMVEGVRSSSQNAKSQVPVESCQNPKPELKQKEQECGQNDEEETLLPEADSNSSDKEAKNGGPSKRVARHCPAEADRANNRSWSKAKSRSASEPKTSSFKKNGETKARNTKDLERELESEAETQTETEAEAEVETEPRIYHSKKGKSSTRESRNACFREKKSNNKYSQSRSKKGSNSSAQSKSSFSSSSRSRFHFHSGSSGYSDSSGDSDFDSSSSSVERFNKRSSKSKIKLDELIRDYSNLYAEYIVSKNLSKINAYY